jgi:hypothetical protein
MATLRVGAASPSVVGQLAQCNASTALTFNMYCLTMLMTSAFIVTWSAPWLLIMPCAPDANFRPNACYWDGRAQRRRSDALSAVRDAAIGG